MSGMPSILIRVIYSLRKKKDIRPKIIMPVPDQTAYATDNRAPANVYAAAVVNTHKGLTKSRVTNTVTMAKLSLNIAPISCPSDGVHLTVMLRLVTLPPFGNIIGDATIPFR
jgi:hypothetical protein